MYDYDTRDIAHQSSKGSEANPVQFIIIPSR